MGEVLAQTDHVVMTDGAHATEHNARVLGFAADGDRIEAGAAPTERT